ncbi:secretin N-terminal domain-containing protein, partial [Candidatus Dependentiae bacterium]
MKSIIKNIFFINIMCSLIFFAINPSENISLTDAISKIKNKTLDKQQAKNMSLTNGISKIKYNATLENKQKAQSIKKQDKKIPIAIKNAESQNIDDNHKNHSISTKKSHNITSENQEIKNDIYLNFENTELSNFINYMAELKKINLMPHKTIQGIKISLNIREPLNVDGAWNVFLTVIEMAGFSIIKRAEVYTIIPKANKRTQPLPAYINVPLENLPNSDINIRYVTFLENISVNNVQGILKNMLSPEHLLIPYPEVNGLIITDKSYNIKAAMKVILELDQTGLKEAVVVMRLKRANSTDVKTLFQPKESQDPLARLLGKQAESNLKYFSATTKIIDEPRTNSLILLGNKKSIEKIEEFIVNNIDTDLKGVQSPLHIYELQNIDAGQAKEILEQVTESPELQQASKYGAVRGGVKYFKAMKFGIDKDGNRLIVSSTDNEDWKLLKKTIEDLDKPQPQVALETLIVSVNITDGKELGGSIRNKNEGQIGKGVNFQSPTNNGTIQKGTSAPYENSLLGNMIAGLTKELGSSILTFGRGTNIWGVFKALKTNSNTSILSQPFFTVINKSTANINIGSTNRYQSQTATGGLAGYDYASAKTDVKITPQINLDGIIRLTIETIFSEFTDASKGNKDEKTLKTDVSVADGQVLVLGGFIKTKVTEDAYRTPILGTIPILGWMFKNKKRTISKDYIFIFISPTIIRPRSVPGINLYTKMKLHDATEYVENSVQTKKINDPIHNWFFNPEKENYSHKVVDFANARYQPTTVDIKNDPYYRVHLESKELE